MLTRALLVLLLVLNLGVATWWLLRGPPPKAAPAPLPVGAQRLQLTSEAAATAIHAAAAAGNGSDALVEKPAAPTTTATAAVEAPAAETPAAEAAVPPAPTAQCLSLGPFASTGAVAQAQVQVKPLVERVSVRKQEPSRGRGWRVFQPPSADAAAADAAAQRIAAAGFSDYFVVREGAEANSVALGRYGSEAAARKRADALVAAGIPAQAAPVGGEGDATTVYWLDVAAAAGFDAGKAQTLVAATERRQLDCRSLR
ncbi:SPOR domain-containing protein [Montanilutibacter psychrotolerans]|uniref:SPOR domain-containing protein n=1 Tax=Montanilutibacter psychrotolerans TaxID=1327343 RepID=A0A3M8STW1_9GAMM|nr:SPOR domain-containing protein [Lysobacter psychrotolerans]RNF82182.1 SPOR domain-containing protein [Lysobacter psychrotolerans]